ncbi:Mitochondrial glycoprotein family protein [Melia azedarach]|uniref:Mitochondrial glycoprotein family protein n=1 Tax=Melia azedarach TaxID=155640 RepID=A0ACC1Y4S2_MELAZ|nr:Mitochondrial glycoprotein family protein [Melia azedarach]
MAGLIRSVKRTQLLCKAMIFSSRRQNPSLFVSSLNNPISEITRRNYIAEMRKSAFEGNILRLLRNEIQYELERSPPKQVRLRLAQTRPFCKNSPRDNSNGGKIESNVSNYNDPYKQLDKLDFMTAAKILFTDPPKKKKFGIDFHLVQLFFACMPSLAVYLVAQYARYEMRRMEAELEQKKALEEKKKQEEGEKAKELELKEAEEKAKSNPELLEVKKRLGKLEEAVNEIVVESKKQISGSITKNLEDGDEKKHPAKCEPGDNQSRMGSSSSVEKGTVGKPKSGETTGLGQVNFGGSPSIGDSPREDQMGKTKSEGPSEDANR